MNVEVVARVRPPKRGENVALNVSGNRIQATDGTGHTFSSVYSGSSLTYELFKESFLPLVDLLLAGYNVCVIALGETGSGKSYSLAGEKTAKAGLIPLLINSVFTKLTELRSGRTPAARIQANTTERGRESVTIQMYEVYNEVIKDLLLLPHEDKLVSIVEEVARGVHVKGGTVQRVADAADCTAVFRKGWSTRCQSQTDFGAAEAKLTTFFMLDLSLVRTNQEPFHSRLLVVELPGAEKLADDPTQLRMREGPTLNRSILALGHLVGILAASPQATRVVSYNDSLVTMLLRDALGGNCITKVLTTLHPFNTVALATVLRTADQLAQVHNFPVTNDFFARELISQYRSRILHLESQAKRSGNSTILPDNASSGIRAQELREQMAQMTNENLQLQDKTDQLYSRLEQLQARYSELMSSKTQLSSKLIFSEEEKLQVSKTLVDLQLENNRIQEETEAAKFELTNKVLALENRVLELENVLERERKAADKAYDRLTQLETDRKELADEYIVLKSNHIALTQDYQKEVTKNDELGLELLGLVNMKEKMVKDKEEDRIKQMQDYYGQLRKLASKFSRSSLREKDDLSRSLISLQSEKFELEKQLLQTNQARDGRIDVLHSQHQLQMKKLEERISKLQEDVKGSKSMYRESQRRFAQQAAELITANSERSRLQEENDSLDHRFKELNVEYNNRLQQYVHDIAVFCGQTGNAQKQFSLESLQSYIDATVRKIRDGHEKREEILETRLRKLKASIKDLVRRHEKLLSAYRLAQYDLHGKGDGLHSTRIDEEFKFPTDEDFQTAQTREITHLTTALKESERTVASLKEKLAKSSDNFDRYKKQSEVKLHTKNTKSVQDVAPLSGAEGSWGHLRTQLREFTLNTQQELERERASLLTRCAVAEEQSARLQDYVQTQLKRYQEEIVRLKKLLAEKTGRANSAEAAFTFGNVR